MSRSPRTTATLLGTALLVIALMTGCSEEASSTGDSATEPINVEELKTQFKKEAEATINESNLEDELRKLQNEISTDDG